MLEKLKKAFYYHSIMQGKNKLSLWLNKGANVSDFFTSNVAALQRLMLEAAILLVGSLFRWNPWQRGPSASLGVPNHTECLELWFYFWTEEEKGATDGRGSSLGFRQVVCFWSRPSRLVCQSTTGTNSSVVRDPLRFPRRERGFCKRAGFTPDII